MAPAGDLLGPQYGPTAYSGQCRHHMNRAISEPDVAQFEAKWRDSGGMRRNSEKCGAIPAGYGAIEAGYGAIEAGCGVIKAGCGVIEGLRHIKRNVLQGFRRR